MSGARAGEPGARADHDARLGRRRHPPQQPPHHRARHRDAPDRRAVAVRVQEDPGAPADHRVGPVEVDDGGGAGRPDEFLGDEVDRADVDARTTLVRRPVVVGALMKDETADELRTTYGDHERFVQTYFSTYKGYYFTGDGCRLDTDGDYWLLGRVDDVMNVSGHRIGTAEVENAINMHADVIESAVVGYPHDIKGQGMYAYVILGSSIHDHDLTRKDILQTVTRIIGAIAKPDKIQFVTGLPKTRSGKIMRRILRKIAEGETENLGDTSTLLDPAVVDEIKAGAKGL